MGKLIKVWDGTTWQTVAVGLPYNFPSQTSNSGKFLTTNGSTLSWASAGLVNSSISSNVTLAGGNRYFVDTTAARTLTLPASPTLGDEIQVFDATGTAATNNITIARNGSNINGVADDAIIDVNQASSILVYTGATVGWRFE